MILCDTNILIEFYKKNPIILQELYDIGQGRLAISPITQAGLYFGTLNKQELGAIKRHLSLIHCYHLNPDISARFLQLIEYYSLSHRLSIPDALIATTTLTHDLPLYTLNIKDFRFIPGIKLYSRLQPA